MHYSNNLSGFFSCCACFSLMSGFICVSTATVVYYTYHLVVFFFFAARFDDYFIDLSLLLVLSFMAIYYPMRVLTAVGNGERNENNIYIYNIKWKWKWKNKNKE